MKTALGIDGFPIELSLKSNSKKPIPVLEFDKNPETIGNLFFWCASTGCGISREILEIVPEQIKSFLLFHIYFTTRRILFEMGGIKSEAALPGDSTFSQINQNYDRPSFKRICAEFGINPRSDFRFKRGLNHGWGMFSSIFHIKGYHPQILIIQAQISLAMRVEVLKKGT